MISCHTSSKPLLQLEYSITLYKAFSYLWVYTKNYVIFHGSHPWESCNYYINVQLGSTGITQKLIKYWNKHILHNIKASLPYFLSYPSVLIFIRSGVGSLAVWINLIEIYFKWYISIYYTGIMCMKIKHYLHTSLKNCIWRSTTYNYALHKISEQSLIQPHYKEQTENFYLLHFCYCILPLTSFSYLVGMVSYLNG